MVYGVSAVDIVLIRGGDCRLTKIVSISEDKLPLILLIMLFMIMLFNRVTLENK